MPNVHEPGEVVPLLVQVRKLLAQHASIAALFETSFSEISDDVERQARKTKPSVELALMHLKLLAEKMEESPSYISAKKAQEKRRKKA